jgi:hypothetical protein
VLVEIEHRQDRRARSTVAAVYLVHDASADVEYARPEPVGRGDE